MSRRIDRPSVAPLADEERLAIEAERARHRRRRPTRTASGMPRKRTIARKNITRAVLAAEAFISAAMPQVEDFDRPTTRGECRDEMRPCPFVSCKFHLYLDVSPTTGSITLNYPHLEPWELQHTCSLDVAERGGITLEEVGELMNLTRERIRQVEIKGLLTLKRTRTMRESA